MLKKTSIYLDEDLDDGLARRAAEEGITKAEFIRRTPRRASCSKPKRPKPKAVGLIDDGPRRVEERRQVPRRNRLRRRLTIVADTSFVLAVVRDARSDHAAALDWIETSTRTSSPRRSRSPRSTTWSVVRPGENRRARRRLGRLRRGAYAVRWWADALARDARHRPPPSRTLGLTDASLVALAGRAAHATASPPSTSTSARLDHADGEPFVVLPADRLKGPDPMAPRAPQLLRRPRHAEGRRPRARRSSASTRCSRSSTSRGCRSASRSCSRTCCAPRATARSTRPTSRRSRRWDAKAEPSKEIAFTPARVVMQDFTGVPAVVDLAAMRDAMADLGGDPAKIEPLVPAELVIDHSVQVDEFGTRTAFAFNAEREFERNQERYEFLQLGPGRVRDLQGRPARHRHRPPGQPRVPRARRSSSTTRPARPTPTRSSAPTRTRR